MNEQDIIVQAERLYRLTDCQFNRVPGHDGGRNIIYIVTTPAGEKNGIAHFEPDGQGSV